MLAKSTGHDLLNKFRKTLQVISLVSPQFSQFLTHMPNPDLLLQQTGKTIQTYREMLLDGRISSLIDLRKGAVLEHPWHIFSADD